MRADKRLINRLAIVTALACLSLTMIAGAGQGGTPANAAAPPGTPKSGTQTPKADPILVSRVYFRNTAERDSLAVELGAEEVATLGGFITAFISQQTYANLL